MAIDDCKYSFAQLASENFPRYMNKLRQNIKQSTPMAQFAVKGARVATLLKQLNVKAEFSGCYVLLDTGIPVYVGISRTVLRRLRQHVLGTSHFDATFAYKMAFDRRPHQTTRNAAMADEEFSSTFRQARDDIRGMDVAFIKIKNSLELHVFEPYCAMALDTEKWNTFATH
jgi:hypothetical protein